MITDRLGDVLTEIAKGNVSQSRLDYIQRVFNELSAREEKYKSWLSIQGDNPHFKAIYADEVHIGKDVLAGLGCRLKRTTAQTISVTTETAVQFDTEDYDDGNIVDLATSTTDITIPRTGRYALSFGGSWAGPASGGALRKLGVYKNGSVAWPHSQLENAAPYICMQGGYDERELLQGDVLTLVAYHDHAGGLDLASAFLTVRLVRSYPPTEQE